MNAGNNAKYPSLKVLVVEDNMVNQKVTAAMLKHFSITADIAENGQIAVDMARSNKYDLVLMDCQMPVMNGFDATIKLRKLDKNADATNVDIPILAMTANSAPEDAVRCIESGMNDVIAKPVELNTLINILQKWVGPGEETDEVLPTVSGVIVSGVDDVLENKVVKELYELMGDDYKTVFDAFLTSLNEHLPNLKTAVENKNVQDVVTITHTLKGSSANIGANRFSCASKRFLESAREGDLSDAASMLEKLLAESEKVCAAIQDLMK